MSDSPSLESVIDSVVAEEAAASADPVVADAPTPEVVADAPADTSTPADASTPAAPAPLADDTLVEVLVDGKPVQMAWGDARKGVMMQSAFTKKTQALATERQQVEALRADAEARAKAADERTALLDQIIRDPQKLSALYMALQAQQQGQPASPQAFAPQQPALDPLALKNAVVQEALHTIQFKQTEAAIESDVTAFTSGLIESEPLLSIYPGFADKVYEEVAKMGPSTPAEAKDYIRGFIEDVKGKLRAAQDSSLKAAAVAKTKAAAATIPGGSVVVPSPKKYAKLADMEEDMHTFLDQFPAQG